MSGAGWFEEVAAKANVDIREVESVLRRRGIRPRASAPRAKTLRITALRFSGRKAGNSTDPFDFSWSGLGDGVWAVASDGDNLVGKSTVLEIMLWCLRGTAKGLQEDVRLWLEGIRLDFALDGQDHVVDLALLANRPTGSLSRVRPNGEVEELDRFSSDEGFGLTMSRFMMEALDLEPIPSQSGKDEAARIVEHNWPALSAGLYFGGEHEHLLGDTPFGGLPGRILQLYVGIPWASTVMQASTALKQVDVEGKVDRAVAAEAGARNAGIRARIEGELAAARKALEGSSDVGSYAERMEELARDVACATGALLDAERRLAPAEDEARSLKSAADADEREVRGIRESFVATSFFNGLQPTCCPRCEAGVSRERMRREADDFSCSVCSEPIDPDRMEGVNERLEEAEDRLTATRAASRRADVALRELRTVLVAAKADVERARATLAGAAASGGLRERRDQELEVARLEGSLSQLPVDGAAAPPTSDRAVVKAAHGLAKAEMDAAGGTMFRALNDEVLDLAQRFGIAALESVAINAQGHMALRKGGADTKFSDVTKGERLRLRLATAIGLLKVGQRLGVGHHPGLLIVDSPSAEETEEANFGTLLRELRGVADREVGVQVFLSSANAAKVTEVLDPANCLVARKGDKLW